MPYIDAIVFTKWVKDAEDTNVPNAIADIYAWAIANGEFLPYDPDSYGKYQDLTAQANIHQRILDNLAVFCAKLEITVTTAQHFAGDNRIWTLGYWRKDDEGAVIEHNWDTTLTAGERQQAVSYVTSNSAITAQQLTARFDATDTRRQIAQKLRAFFRE